MHFAKLLSVSFLAVTSVHALAVSNAAPSSARLAAREPTSDNSALAETVANGLEVRSASQPSFEEAARALAIVITALAFPNLIGTISQAVTDQVFTILVGNSNIEKLSALLNTGIGQGGATTAQQLGTVLAALKTCPA